MMIDSKFDIDKEYDEFLEAMVKLDDKAVLDIHTKAMKLAFVMAISRMSRVTEKFENLSWEETAEIKKNISRQLRAYFADAEADNQIFALMSEINDFEARLKHRQYKHYVFANTACGLAALVLAMIIMFYDPQTPPPMTVTQLVRGTWPVMVLLAPVLAVWSWTKTKIKSYEK